MVQALGPDDPRQAGRYRLLSRLGRGGMGQVFLGQSPGGRLVAVKLIRPELAGDPGFRARFAREVATARTVGGIFTVPVVDADTDGPRPWLATAYVDGPSLADAIADQGPFPPAQALTLTAGLAEGLEAIHAAGVVHRDLKPSNVLLAPDGPRIIDFGISRATDSTGLTRTGWVTGSPGFMSPEQAEGGQVGPASDIFSLGSVLGYAVTGREPFGTGAATAVLYRVVHGEPDLDGAPEEIQPLVLRCMARDPQRRPTAGQILAELGGTRLTERPEAVPPHVAPASPGPPPRRAAPPPPPAYLPTATAERQSLPGNTAAWPAQPASGTEWPDTPRYPPGNRRHGLAWAAAALAVVVAAAAVVLALRHDHSSARAAGQGVATGTRPAATPSRLVVQGTGTEWHTYKDPSGFSIKLPPGWGVSARGKDEVWFTGSPPGYTVLVAWTTAPKRDALSDWRAQAAAKAAADSTYQQISIRRVHYRGWNAADWEFSNMYQGRLTRVLDRGFVVDPGQLGYAIEFYGPDTMRWRTVHARMWGGLLASFSPA